VADDDERSNDSDDHGGARTVCTISERGSRWVNGTEDVVRWTAQQLAQRDDKYKAATATQKTIAAKASSGLAWSTPAPITYGTLLSSVQLDGPPTLQARSCIPGGGDEAEVPVAPARPATR